MKNKKLFAILTLVCFMFTLMPVAAFAADYAQIDSEYAVVKLEEGKAKVKVDFTADDVYYVYAVDATGSLYKGLIKANGGNNAANFDGVVEMGHANGFAEVYFQDAGTYTVYATKVADVPATLLGDTDKTRAQKLALLKDEAVTMLDNTVTIRAAKTDYHFADKDGVKVEKLSATVAKANGVAYDTVEVFLQDADNNAVIGADVTISTNSSAVDVSKSSIKTNAAGQVKFDISATVAGTFEVYVEYGNKADVTVTVEAGTTGAADIAKKYDGGKVDVDTDLGETDMMFTVTDINGNVVKNGEDFGFTVKVVKAPANSNVTNKSLETAELFYYGPESAWMITGVELDEEGEYEFKVILDNGASAIANVTVSEFQTPVAISLNYQAAAVELNGYNYMKTLKFVDANGVKTTKGTDEIKVAANGYAVDTFGKGLVWNEDTEEYDLVALKGAVKAKADEKYVGSTITVNAVSTKYNLVATTSMVVANEAAEVKYATTNADVAVNNTLTANIVDVDGNKVALKNGVPTITYIVLEKPENAKVAVSTANSDNLATKGELKVSFTASTIGEYKVQTVVTYEQADGVVKYYTGVETITVGNTGINDVVVMSVNSNEIVKNGEVAVIDAAPIVENNRTFVPFRALAEAFGATVAFDEATQAVTAELNGTTVVMTIGSAEYTVNGVANTADVAPFINGSRTMVPVRFVAEAFGIKVTPTYDDNGATADILFAK